MADNDRDYPVQTVDRGAIVWGMILIAAISFVAGAVGAYWFVLFTIS